MLKMQIKKRTNRSDLVVAARGPLEKKENPVMSQFAGPSTNPTET